MKKDFILLFRKLSSPHFFPTEITEVVEFAASLAVLKFFTVCWTKRSKGGDLNRVFEMCQECLDK